MTRVTGSMKWPFTKVHKMDDEMESQRKSKVPKGQPSRNIELKVGKSQKGRSLAGLQVWGLMCLHLKQS